MPERDASYGCLHDESANTLNNTHRRNKKSEKSFDDDKNELQMLLWFVLLLRLLGKNNFKWLQFGIKLQVVTHFYSTRNRTLDVLHILSTIYSVVMLNKL